MFLTSIIIKSFTTIFYKNKQTYLKISDWIKNMFNSFILQMIIFIYTMIYHILKEYKNDAQIIKKFKNKFIIDEWFQSRKKVTILLIFEKWFNFQTTFDTFMREKNRYIYKTCQKDKARTAKVHFEIDRSKKKELKNNDDEFIHFFYKDSLNNLHDIKDSDSEYESKCRQKKNVSC